MLTLLSYHQKVLDHFKHQTKTWDFFTASQNKDEQLNQYKTELLKNTYKFDPEKDTSIYEKVAKSKQVLGLDINVYVYQAQYSDELNASVGFVNNEAHIVFSGQIIQLLDDDELLTVIAHELSHIKLYTMQGGDPEVAARIITAISNNYDSESSYMETARLFRLYTEIFCDRGAYEVQGSTGPVITSLVKTATGLKQVNAESYIKQAEEIFSADQQLKAASISHPENFIRARAIHLWHEKKEAAEEEIIRMIEGVTDIDALDIFKQKELAACTRQFLQLYLKPNWFRSTLVVSQAKQYFVDFSWDDKIILEETFITRMEKAHESVKNYFSYVLLDFALLDSTLEEIPFGWAFQFAEDIDIKETFDAVVKKELNLSDKKLQQHKQKTLSAFYNVKEGDGEQIYEG
ncbi:M48 family metalloprotease [Cytophaga hutchinsonii]|uniref:Peptidase, M48 family n=1 Tax=Cytophaga hutchinsonii (strain ATCC 33406 / DSM 1761 / CIP 103989 / NBRC 15051 / NCIMB 9469 / D465) TaxID=269798 RepID=A0A6N4ST14_CYTH3|nr:M48 family metalloprotease [Cytophaga hutchinsonii]ABG59427.1 peptidase, M48 family [Cytophaga hutchinsonii ATCC 33406]SFY02237.1 Zn-dependent protease with chaperone function [Cytophaga hutchinsonii ATCC 33406]